VLAVHSYKSIFLALLSGWALAMTQATVTAGEVEQAEQGQLQLHVVFNNVPCKPGLETGWGFSCLITGLDKTVLFDTGSNGDILLANMQRLGLDPEGVDAIVLSHIHSDHTGGLEDFLLRNPDVTVYMPASFPASFQWEIKRLGAATETISAPGKLLDSVYSTGEMGRATREQALIVDTTAGLVLITGCAHPDVAAMAEQAQSYLGKNIYLLLGGFHLRGSSDAHILATIQRLKALGIRKVAPSHCTGDTAIRMFRAEWAGDFIEGGLGAVIEVPR
jgi:7,8-dihydropterin-6-yl-methyl-4-(beta-D-ribofuranosyl)aminobenzene 5'-phosphate synthase